MVITCCLTMVLMPAVSCGCVHVLDLCKVMCIQVFLWILQGVKLQYGHVPLYVRGDDANAKQFASLHAVQRHMVDANRCKMVFEDNEEEYEDFYDWSKLLEEEEGALTKRLCLCACVYLCVGVC